MSIFGPDFNGRVFAIPEQGSCEPVQPTRDLRKAAERVCWFDWSGNDADAVRAIDDLRSALATPTQAVAPTEGIGELVARLNALKDDSLPMACEAGEMTAAEDVLAWLIVEKIGVPDDEAYTPHQAQQIISNALEVGYRAEGDLHAVSTAIGSVRFMDPPDGGDVSLAEQVARMRSALEASEAEASDLRRKLEERERAGKSLANAAFNISRMNLAQIDATHLLSLRAAQEAWDLALAASPSAQTDGGGK